MSSFEIVDSSNSDQPVRFNIFSLAQVKGLYRRRCGAWEASRYRGAFAARLGSAPGFRDVYGMRVRWRSLKSAAAVRVW